MPTITQTQAGWIRFTPSYTHTISSTTVTIPDQFDDGPSNNSPIGSLGFGDESRCYWLFNLGGLSSITSGSLRLILENSDTYNLGLGQGLQIVDATSSYTALASRTCNATSFGSVGGSSTSFNSSIPLFATNLTPIRTGVALNAAAISAINAAISGSGQIAFGGFLSSIDTTIRQFAMLHSPSLVAQLNIS